MPSVARPQQPLSAAVLPTAPFPQNEAVTSSQQSSPAALASSAIRIQKVWKGYRERRDFSGRVAWNRERLLQLCLEEDLQLCTAERVELEAKEEIHRLGIARQAEETVAQLQRSARSIAPAAWRSSGHSESTVLEADEISQELLFEAEGCALEAIGRVFSEESSAWGLLVDEWRIASAAQQELSARGAVCALEEKTREEIGLLRTSEGNFVTVTHSESSARACLTHDESNRRLGMRLSLLEFFETSQRHGVSNQSDQVLMALRNEFHRSLQNWQLMNLAASEVKCREEFIRDESKAWMLIALQHLSGEEALRRPKVEFCEFQSRRFVRETFATSFLGAVGEPSSRLLLQQEYSRGRASILTAFVQIQESSERALVMRDSDRQAELFELEASHLQMLVDESTVREELVTSADRTLQQLFVFHMLQFSAIRSAIARTLAKILILCAVSIIHLQNIRTGLEHLALSQTAARARLNAEEEGAWRKLQLKHSNETALLAMARLRSGLALAESAARAESAKAESEARDALLQKEKAMQTEAHRRRKAAWTLQCWALRCLRVLHKAQVARMVAAATRIQAQWRGFLARRWVRRTVGLVEEQRVLLRLNLVERRQLQREENQGFESILTRFQHRLTVSTRLRRELYRARQLTAAAKEIQQWWVATLRTLRHRRSRELPPESQERPARRALATQLLSSHAEFCSAALEELRQAQLQHLRTTSATRISKLWRGYRVRRALPKLRAYQEGVQSLVDLWKVERALLLREEHNVWVDFLALEVEQREAEMRDPGRGTRRKLQEARQRELEVAAQEKAQREETRRQQRLAELQEEREVVIMEESLARRSLRREYEHTLAELVAMVKPMWATAVLAVPGAPAVLGPVRVPAAAAAAGSEERRVGKGGRTRGWPYH
eukprot:RCo020089